MTNQPETRLSRINESAMRKDCIAKHGEALGSILFTHELAAAREFEAQHDAALKDQADVEAQIAKLESSLRPELDRLRATMNQSYSRWLADCIALENRRVANDAACSALVQRRSELQTRLSMSVSLLGGGTWAKSNLFPEPLPELTGLFHKEMHAQQQRAKDRQ